MNGTPVSRPCPVCGDTEAADYLLKAGLRLVRCRRCGMVYASPVPEEFVSGAYYDRLGADYYLSPDKLESDFAEVRFERELRLFRAHCARGTVLDVGCSTGAFLYQLNKRFPSSYDLAGADASGPALAHAASRGLRVVRGEFPAVDFAGETFDAVTFWAVLEHLNEPRTFLDKAWSVLKPQGLCFALVPNLESLAARLLGGRYRYFYPQHLNYFTPKTLVNLVAARFTVVASTGTHFNPVVVWQDWRGRGKDVSEQERAQLLKRTTAYKQNPWLRPVKALYRLAETALSRLNLADNLVVVLRKR